MYIYVCITYIHVYIYISSIIPHVLLGDIAMFAQAEAQSRSPGGAEVWSAHAQGVGMVGFRGSV